MHRCGPETVASCSSSGPGERVLPRVHSPAAGDRGAEPRERGGARDQARSVAIRVGGLIPGDRGGESSSGSARTGAARAGDRRVAAPARRAATWPACCVRGVANSERRSPAILSVEIRVTAAASSRGAAAGSSASADRYSSGRCRARNDPAGVARRRTRRRARCRRESDVSGPRPLVRSLPANARSALTFWRVHERPLAEPALGVRLTIEPLTGSSSRHQSLHAAALLCRPRRSTQTGGIRVRQHNRTRRTRRAVWYFCEFREFCVDRCDPKSGVGIVVCACSPLDGRLQRFRDFAGDVVLDHQDVVERPVVGFRPDHELVLRAKQPRGDPQPGA